VGWAAGRALGEREELEEEEREREGRRRGRENVGLWGRVGGGRGIWGLG
jgi:hypothetical protein